MPNRNIKGFTLIELLVVIAIIGTLASVVLASLNSARERAQVSAIATELREMEKAIISAAITEGRSILWPESDFGGGNPDISEVIAHPNGSVIATYLPNAPTPAIGNRYQYDQDGNDVSVCDNGNNSVIRGANIILIGGGEIFDQLDEMIDGGDGNQCGKIRRSGSNIFYKLADDPRSF